MILFIVLVIGFFFCWGVAKIAYDACITIDKVIVNLSGKDGVKTDNRQGPKDPL